MVLCLIGVELAAGFGKTVVEMCPTVGLAVTVVVEVEKVVANEVIEVSVEVIASTCVVAVEVS